jgi:hypothetical protein
MGTAGIRRIYYLYHFLLLSNFLFSPDSDLAVDVSRVM